ncbi:MAG TPA: hypothetical protein PKM21_15960 [Anaerolineales bacterium]|nr:hypothetical protein [Anaerolineales bacterium]
MKDHPIYQKVARDFKEWRAKRPTLERDYGVWWTLLGDPQAAPKWRVSWILATGELYAVHLCDQGLWLPLGSLSTVEVEWAMEGWANHETPFYRNLAALAEHLDEWYQAHPDTQIAPFDPKCRACCWPGSTLISANPDCLQPDQVTAAKTLHHRLLLAQLESRQSGIRRLCYAHLANYRMLVARMQEMTGVPVPEPTLN